MSDVAIFSGIINHEVLPIVLYVTIVSKDYYHGKQIKIYNSGMAKNPRRCYCSIRIKNVMQFLGMTELWITENTKKKTNVNGEIAKNVVYFSR